MNNEIENIDLSKISWFLLFQFSFFSFMKISLSNSSSKSDISFFDNSLSIKTNKIFWMKSKAFSLNNSLISLFFCLSITFIKIRITLIYLRYKSLFSSNPIFFNFSFTLNELIKLFK